MKNEKRRFGLGTMLMILTILLISCTSCPKNDVTDLLEWSVFPDPIVDGKSVVSYSSETETVSMPLSYWIKITEYVCDVDANVQIIKNAKK